MVFPGLFWCCFGFVLVLFWFVGFSLGFLIFGFCDGPKNKTKPGNTQQIKTKQAQAVKFHVKHMALQAQAVIKHMALQAQPTARGGGIISPGGYVSALFSIFGYFPSYFSSFQYVSAFSVFSCPFSSSQQQPTSSTYWLSFSF